jgi:uncharacterized membrane protein
MAKKNPAMVIKFNLLIILKIKKNMENQNDPLDSNQADRFVVDNNLYTDTKVSNDRSFKKIILGMIILIAVTVALLSVYDHKHPGSVGMLVIPLMPIVWIFYPVYFTILALRYSREKGEMDILDKVTFYVLLAHIGLLFATALRTL